MRTTALKISNYILLVATALLVATGLILEFRLAGHGASRGLELMSLARHEWLELHSWIAYGFMALALLHLFLNWGWIRKVATGGRRLVVLCSVGFCALIVTLPLVVPTQSRSSELSAYEEDATSEHRAMRQDAREGLNRGVRSWRGGRGRGAEDTVSQVLQFPQEFPTW